MLHTICCMKSCCRSCHSAARIRETHALVNSHISLLTTITWRWRAGISTASLGVLPIQAAEMLLTKAGFLPTVPSVNAQRPCGGPFQE